MQIFLNISAYLLGYLIGFLTPLAIYLIVLKVKSKKVIKDLKRLNEIKKLTPEEKLDKHFLNEEMQKCVK